jgi:hypothetical protein
MQANSLDRTVLRLTLVLSIAAAACGDHQVPGYAEPASERATEAQSDGDLATLVAPRAGTARVSLTAPGLTVGGEYPAILCGGPYMLGEGMAYQTKAGDWQITVASEDRVSGDVPLNESDNQVRVVVTANGPGRQFVRGPRNGGSLVVGDDFMKAEANLQLRQVVGRDTARLIATFECS